MASLLERMRSVSNRGASPKTSVKDIFFTFQEGDNNIRLADNFFEVYAHFIAPVPNRNDRGFADAEAFKGDDRIPKMINCIDWDTEKEMWTGKHECPICKLSQISKKISNDPDCSADEHKFFAELQSSARARRSIKWNIIDRNDPFITENDEKVKGYKIASIGIEAFRDIQGIAEQTGLDINGTDDGCDIIVTKSKGGRWEYSARVAMTNDRPPQVAMTPLTNEEREMKLHDLKEICGKKVEADAIIKVLHQDLQDLLSLNDDDSEKKS